MNLWTVLEVNPFTIKSISEDIEDLCQSDEMFNNNNKIKDHSEENKYYTFSAKKEKKLVNTEPTKMG